MRLTGSVAAKVAFMLCIPVIFEVTVIASSMHLLNEIDSARQERKKVSNIIALYASTLAVIMRDHIRFFTVFSSGKTLSRQKCNQIYQSTYDATEKLTVAWKNAGFDFKEINDMGMEAHRRYPKATYGFDEKLLKEQVARQDLLANVVLAVDRSIHKRANVLQEREQKERELFWKMNVLLIAALVTSLLLTLGLCFIINRLLLDRLATVSENTRRLAMDKPLLEMLRGDDEVAQLDKTFRTMAQTLANAREKDQLILDNSSDIIAAIDENYCFQKVSKACELVWQIEEEHLLNSHISEILGSDSQVETLNMLDRARESNTVAKFENTTVAADGTEIPSLWSVKWTEEESLFIAVIHDSRNRKEAETKRQELLAMVSHDLRSPLTTATLSLDTLLKDDSLDSKARNELSKVNKSVEHVVSTTNDLIDLMRIQQDRISLNLALVSIEKAKTLLEKRLDDENIPCDITISASNVSLILDEDYFPRVVLALIRHLRLSSGEGKILIEISFKKPTVIFKIESTAPGNSKESDESKRISWEISLGLTGEILNKLKGDLLTSWTAKGQPVYNLILPICEIEEED